MQRNAKTIGLVVAAVLVVLGIVLVVITEPAGEDGSRASGGVADVSEDTRPYLWYGIVAIVAGIAVGAWAWFKANSSKG